MLFILVVAGVGVGRLDLQVVGIVVVVVVAKLTLDLTPTAHHFVRISGRGVRHRFLRLDPTDPVPSVSAATTAASDRWRKAIASVVEVVVNQVNVVRPVYEVLTRVKGRSG